MDSEEGQVPRSSPLKALAPSSAVTSPVKQSPAKAAGNPIPNPATPTASPATSPSFDPRSHFIPSLSGSTTHSQNQSGGQSTANNTTTQGPASQINMENDSVNAGGASVTDDSCASQAVLLGIQTLERQQLELERKRKNNQKFVPRANPFDSVHQYVGGQGSSKKYRPQDHTDVPSTVHFIAEGDSPVANNDSKDKVSVTSTGDTTKRHSRVKSMTKGFLNKVSTPLVSSFFRVFQKFFQKYRLQCPFVST